MTFPSFFEQAPRLKVRDALAELLGAASGGVLEYRYEDAVKLAGHSCPTVASAYQLTRLALLALWPDQLPQRGAVLVEFAAPFGEGVTGVIASVVTLLTGAAQEGGFKGLAGQHVRRDLQRFSREVPWQMRLTRQDTGAAVDASSDLSVVPADRDMSPLLSACLAGRASEEQRRRFAELWQQRVAKVLLDFADDPRVFRIRAVPAATSGG
ncbi:MAG: hypothetical protein IT494_04390 [Gammaproteobacteria bacterium]|nr:hypothetical protein [Gammaproteobacteria bacterium]